jgi:hypothetical protein
MHVEIEKERYLKKVKYISQWRLNINYSISEAGATKKPTHQE